MIATVCFVDDPGALLEHAMLGEPDAIVLDLRPPATGALASLIVDLVAETPRLPVIVYDRPDRATIEVLQSVLTPGLRMEFVVRPFEPLPSILRQMLLAPFPPTAGPVLVQHIIPLAPPSVRVFLTLAALKAPTTRGLEQIARWSGAIPRTVERRLQRAGWSGPQIVIQTFRALDAAWLMAEHGWSARRLRLARGLTHASVVTRLLQRYCGGITPATLRELGGFDTALAAALQTLILSASSR